MKLNNIRKSRKIQDSINPLMLAEEEYKAIYEANFAYYQEISDDSMPFIFAEFQKGLGKIVYSVGMPTKTPDEMRKYLAHAYSAIDLAEKEQDSRKVGVIML